MTLVLLKFFRKFKILEMAVKHKNLAWLQTCLLHAIKTQHQICFWTQSCRSLGITHFITNSEYFSMITWSMTHQWSEIELCRCPWAPSVIPSSKDLICPKSTFSGLWDSGFSSSKNWCTWNTIVLRQFHLQRKVDLWRVWGRFQAWCSILLTTCFQTGKTITTLQSAVSDVCGWSSSILSR